jgi:phosphoglycerol transferase MdoB-like AlkP superfamily enzyme
MKQKKVFPPYLKFLASVAGILLIVLSLARLVFFQLFKAEQLAFTDVLPAFLLGLRFDIRLVLICILPLFLFMSFMQSKLHLPLFKKIILVYMWVVSVVLVFVYVVDFSHYAYLNQRLNAGALSLLEDTAIALEMVWQSYPVIRMLLGMLVFLFLLNYIFRKLYVFFLNKPISYRQKWDLIYAISCFLLIGVSIFGRINQYPLRWSDAFALGDDFKASIALNPFESFFNTLNFRQKTFDPEKVKTAYPVVAKWLNLGPATPLKYLRVVPEANPTPKNVVVIIMESFSYYKSSVSGNPLNTTPFFDSLSKAGYFFDRAFTSTIGTARGVWGTITGAPDVEQQKTASRNPLAVDQNTIINDFKGYEKKYFLGGSTSWANIRGVLNNNIEGIKIYEDTYFQSPVVDVWGISDKSLFEESNALLKTTNQPFFAVIQTAGNHRPYTIPSVDIPDFQPLTLPLDSLKKYGFESNEEFNAFRYSDYCLKKFFELASQQPYFENTVFAIVGDHGIPGNAKELLPNAFTDLRLNAMHVPMLIYQKGMEPKRFHFPASQLDLLPTVASYIGISYHNTTFGKNLLDTTLTPFAYIYDHDAKATGIVTGDYYFRMRVSMKGSGHEELGSIIHNDPIDQHTKDSILPILKNYTEAFYETAKYLLTNNKKAAAQ